MKPLPPRRVKPRPPRVRLPGVTPAVLRFADGHRVPGQVQILSATGGLLGLSRPLDRGSLVKLMFLTQRGSVFAEAEMLNPISWIQQPFRFVTLHRDDRSRLQTAIQFSLDQIRREHNQALRKAKQLEKHRAW
jgi:hypothetical protein